jgi:hypothetical protein
VIIANSLAMALATQARIPLSLPFKNGRRVHHCRRHHLYAGHVAAEAIMNFSKQVRTIDWWRLREARF